MSPEFPYQIVSFLDKEPVTGEGVYQASNGWYPQIALKRRFRVVDIDEADLISMLADFANDHPKFQLRTGELIKPDRMPVRVVEVLNKDELKQFHLDLIKYMGAHMESRYPERDGDNYLPHITAEYGDSLVIDVDQFELKSFTINRICLIKDEKDTDSHVVSYFDLNTLG